MELFIICGTVLACVALVSHARWTIVVKHVSDTPAAPAPSVDVPDIDEVYKQIDKEDAVPNFTDVIDTINKEFGGLDYDE